MDTQDKLDSYNKSIKNEKYTYYALVCKMGMPVIGVILDLTTSIVDSSGFLIAGVFLGEWSASKFENKRDEEREQSRDEKKQLRDEIKALYLAMAKELLRQYVAPDKHQKSNLITSLEVVAAMTPEKMEELKAS